MEEKKYVVSETPHIRSTETIDSIMLHVLIALFPAGAAGVYFFGSRALLIITLSVMSCLFFEHMFCKIMKRETTVKDLSAVVTGVLLAFNLPVNTSLWIPIVGGFFAIIVVKMIFGGLGQNFMNPALGARAFLLASYPTEVTRWGGLVDGATSATPLEALKNGDFVPQATDYLHALIGNVDGCIGETSALLLALGGGYLIYKKVITWHVPTAFIGTVFISSFIFGRSGLFTGFPLYEVLIGGVMLGSFFMATDYSSSPITAKGKIIMGVGCGFITVIIRTFGGYPEGVSYSILLMNLCVPLIDRYIRPQVFGVEKKKRGAVRG